MLNLRLISTDEFAGPRTTATIGRGLSFPEPDFDGMRSGSRVGNIGEDLIHSESRQYISGKNEDADPHYEIL